jgi:hypothetical protein
VAAKARAHKTSISTQARLIDARTQLLMCCLHATQQECLLLRRRSDNEAI